MPRYMNNLVKEALMAPLPIGSKCVATIYFVRV